ncbi:hypothetical protein PICST_28225 [Scheffersomyces stipitis CBS 6054]|uniref:Uncharacterized protein n=1 Tax=Scheffersomyces stipitis (strain ATCC 58785 / CBS 6054 / NBRC 10063 / NRRL Y-11545) TaxID=322104 RepID=A3GFF2_PICST|nr:predicted protein [Scheffersomyces stipitis CBS 6054]EAZ63747.1 hypothetical protein PICST_28225 [Scheffersomyces stipitis CBS 6054]
MIIDLASTQPTKTSQYSRVDSKIPKTQSDTGIHFKWIFTLQELLTEKVEEAKLVVQNIEDKGEYFAKGDIPVGAIGLLVHTKSEPAAFAGWYQEGHQGDWSVYGDQPENSQQTYLINGAETIFVGLF